MADNVCTPGPSTAKQSRLTQRHFTTAEVIAEIYNEDLESLSVIILSSKILSTSKTMMKSLIELQQLTWISQLLFDEQQKGRREPRLKVNIKQVIRI